jgi:ComF family protein
MSRLTDVLDLLLPVSCAGCGRARTLLCTACRALLEAPARLTHPWPIPPGLPSVWAIQPYAGPIRQLIIAHKEHARTTLARPLGTALATAAETAARSAPALLVPVPSAPATVRARGHDPTLRIAQAAARELRARAHGVVCAGWVLGQRRGVADQAGLTAPERWANLAGALVVRRPGAVRGRVVVLADDVVTTGATLAEAARVLSEAGALVAGAAVVAATPRRVVRTGSAAQGFGGHW